MRKRCQGKHLTTSPSFHCIVGKLKKETFSAVRLLGCLGNSVFHWAEVV